MACGVAEELTGEDQTAARPRVETGHTLDAVSLAIDGVGVRVEEEVDVGLGSYELFFLGVFKLLVGARTLGGMIRKLLDDLADAGKAATANQPHRPHANLA